MKRLVAAAAAAALALGGCENPPLKIVYDVSTGPSQSCGSATCSGVKMECDAVLSIRIITPTDPTVPHVSICEPVPRNQYHNLCSIAQIDLPQSQVPNEVLEVQVVVWPRSMVEDPVTGELDCRKYPVRFGETDGFPVNVSPTPAIGGHAYFHPGESETVVTLGCTDLASVNEETCVGSNTIAVKSTIEDFDLRIAVDKVIGDLLTVSVGEPKLDDDGNYELRPDDTQRLERTVLGPTAAWGAEIDETFETSACVEVREEGPQTTATVRCRRAGPDDKTLDITGSRLSKPSLQQILAALQLPAFPERGLVVGMVLDDNDNPVSGFSVDADTPGTTIRYLSGDRNAVVPGGTATTASGIWISTDAPYGTIFRTFAPLSSEPASAFGGLIKGKASVVLLKFDQPPVSP